jgi:hypothetical protein
MSHSQTNDHHKIVTSRPVDGTAARVVAQGPKGYDSGKKILQALSPTPFATIPLPANAPSLVDLTGWRRGKLTVIGFHGKKRWVCRCVCGYYTLRSARALKNEHNIQDMCDRCRQVTYLRYRSYFEQTGQNKPITEFL